MDSKLSELLFTLSRLKWERSVPFHAESSQLTILQMRTLGLLENRKHVQMRELAAYFHMEMPSATVLVNALFKRGLVVREADSHDRRIVRIVITEKGSELLQTATECYRKKSHAFLGYLSTQDKKDLTRILETIVTKMKEDYQK